MAKKMVTIRNDELGLESEIVETSLATWEELGWTLVDDETSESGSQSADAVELAQPAEPQGQTGDVVPAGSTPRKNGGKKPTEEA